MVGLRLLIIVLFLFSLAVPVFGDQETLYAQDWTSSETITSEASGYGAIDDSSATFSTFISDGNFATASLINDTVTAQGTLNFVEYRIRMSSNGGFANDYFDIQYWDDSTSTWISNATNIQPGTALTTYGYFRAPTITSFAEVDAFQVRILFERVTSPDSIVMNIDAVEVVVDYTPDDLTGPDVNHTAPVNNSWDLDGTVLYQFTPYDASGITNCSLEIDGSAVSTNTSITNSVVNNITHSLADGIYLWSVACFDASPNVNLGRTTVNRTIRIDTTAPIVNLEAPADNNLSLFTQNTFSYNTTDAQTTIASCELIVNDTIRDTDLSVTEDVTQTFTVGLTNGFYEWWVNCTDANGFEGTSVKRNITVNSPTPSIIADKASHELGETAVISGELFSSSVPITINYTLANGSVVSNSTLSSASGTFNDSFFINYNYPVGTYTVFAYETNNLSVNASTDFLVTLLATSLDVLLPGYGQGDEISIRGIHYPVSQQVNITITYNDTSTSSFLTLTNTTGGFFTTFNLSYSAPIDLATVFGYSINFTTINATDNFTISPRFASLLTDLASYERDENVNIFGYNFTRFGLAELAIYDNTTNDVGATFPVNKTSDGNGDFTHLWNTGDTCNGIYRIEAIDINNSVLNDTVYFSINEVISSNTSLLAEGSEKAVGATVQGVTPSNFNSSNDVRESLTSNTKADWYFEFNFSASFNGGLQIDQAIFAIEHQNSGTFGPPILSVWNGTAFEVVGCGDLQMSTPDHLDLCDVASVLSTPSDFNNAIIRVTAEKTSGPSATWAVDYVDLNVTTSYQPACTYFNGTTDGGLAENAPIIQSILLEDDFLTPANELDLSAGIAKFMTCNITATDGDGAANIVSANATIYSTTVSATSSDDNRTHYSNSSCAQTGAAGNEVNYTCGFSVYYYALNGTWECEATVFDDIDSDTAIDNTTMNLLYALNISGTEIDYGTFELGQNSLEQQVNISNIGNALINVTAYGYGALPNDGLSLNCTQNNLSVDATRYALSSSVPFASKNPLSSSLSALNLFIDAQSTVGSAPENTTYWQLEAPGSSSAAGECSGQLVFQADI